MGKCDVLAGTMKASLRESLEGLFLSNFFLLLNKQQMPNKLEMFDNTPSLTEVTNAYG